LDDQELDLTRLLIALVSELASDPSFVEVGVSLLAGLTYAGPGCAKDWAEGMKEIGVGDGDTDWISRNDWLDGSRKVNSSG